MAARARMKKGKSRTHRKGERPPSLHCVGCGEPDEPDALLRIVVSEAHGVVVDPRGRLSGTAFNLHAAAECLARAQKVPSESASPAPVSAAALRAAMEDFLDNALLAELSRAAASGQVVGGHDKLAMALRDGRIAWVLVANDASPGTIDSLERAAGPSLPFHVVHLDRDALGARVGQAPRAAVGVPPGHASAVFAKWLTMRRRLGTGSDAPTQKGAG